MGADACEGRRGFLLAAQELRLEAGRRDARQEVVTVGGIARGARGDGEHALGPERARALCIAPERIGHAVHRHLAERARGVDALAQPRDLEQPLDLRNGAVGADVGHQQPCRVCAGIRRGDAHRANRVTSCIGKGVALPSGTTTRGGAVR